MGGPSGMHGPGQGMGDSRQGMWGGPGGAQGMHPPHGQGKLSVLLDAFSHLFNLGVLSVCPYVRCLFFLSKPEMVLHHSCL